MLILVVLNLIQLLFNNLSGKVDANAQAIESLKGQVGKGNTTIVNVAQKVENITQNINAQTATSKLIL